MGSVVHRVQGRHVITHAFEMSVHLSFESDDQGAVKLYFQEKVTLKKMYGIVTSELAATDSGTVTAANSVGSMTGGVLTFAAGALIGNEQNATPTTNQTIAPGTALTLTPAKTTVGGKVNVCLQLMRN